MFENVIRCILITLFLFISFLFIDTVYALTDYGVLENRIVQNQKMIDNSNKMNSSVRARYKDKYLKDLYETNYKGMTSSQQMEIQNLADNIILKGAKENYSDMDKLSEFYKWIVDNYYYYAYPNKISNLSSNCDNPYYLLNYEYDVFGKIRARGNGYSSMMIALARSQGFPARQVGGYYNKYARDNYINWGSNINSNTRNHKWVQVYVDDSWVSFDPLADSYQVYDDVNNEYNVSSFVDGVYDFVYFNPSVNVLSKTHVAFKYYAGSKDLKYITSSYEKTKLTRFLNKKYSNKLNGKRINSSYGTGYPTTWFVKNDTKSIGDGFGRVAKIYWPSNKSLYGALDLSGFGALDTVSVVNNRITSLSLSNCPNMKKVYISNNKMTKIVVTGSDKLVVLSSENNPATYIKYNYGKTKRTAIIKASGGGVVSNRYYKTSNNKHVHKMIAVPKTGYTFKGWYVGNKLVSKNKIISPYKTQSFTYVAKFEKKTYIYVSIKNQKMWYYNKGKLIKSSKVVTGMKGKYDTPKGTYKILGKAREVDLIGPDYKTFVNYWMLLDRRTQIGLHDATWRYNFGGSIYKYNGSHGCVNLPYDVAKYLYYNVPVGTKVVIK